jgi:hypothetical protein
MLARAEPIEVASKPAEERLAEAMRVALRELFKLDRRESRAAARRDRALNKQHSCQINGRRLGANLFFAERTQFFVIKSNVTGKSRNLVRRLHTYSLLAVALKSDDPGTLVRRRLIEASRCGVEFTDDNGGRRCVRLRNPARRRGFCKTNPIFWL